MKKCTYCGAEYPDELTQCPVDHTTLAGASPAQSTPPPLPASAPPGLAVASLVLGIVSIAFSFLLFGAALALVGVALGWSHLAKKRRPALMARWGIGLSLFGIIASVGFAVFYYSVYKQVTHVMQSPRQGGDLTKWEGVKAPELNLTTLDGKVLKLSDFKGKRVVVDFWATWCPPCRKEIPHFVKLFNETPRDKLVIVGVSDEPTSTLNKFVRDNAVTYPIASGKGMPQPYSSISSIPATFYIDTKGVIQKIDVGYHDYADIKLQALADDFKGEVQDAPAGPKPLADASLKLKPVELWSANISRAGALCAGEWLGNGEPQVLIVAGSKLHVLNLGGSEMAALPLPETFQIIECGHHKAQGPRLLGYDNWGHNVTVMDGRGTKLWQVDAGSGVDAAHWGDLDGDGTDEMVVGMNGGGGLQAWSSDGKKLWTVKLGNVWNQAIVSAVGSQPAVVFATEAGGSVRAFDLSGSPIGTLRPNDGYYAQMAACRTGQGIQIAAITSDQTVVFDNAGKVVWTTSAISNHAGWRASSFAYGDLDGDGEPDWVFIDGSHDLVIANVKGEKLSTLPNGNTISSFAVAPRQRNRGVLVTLSSSVVKAYELKP